MHDIYYYLLFYFIFLVCFAMEFVGVFFGVWGWCQGAIITLFLPLPTFRASMIFDVTFILGHLKKKFTWPSVVDNDNILQFVIVVVVFSKEKEDQKDKQKKFRIKEEEKKKYIKQKNFKKSPKKKKKNYFLSFFFLVLWIFKFLLCKRLSFFWCVFGKLEGSTVLILTKYVWKVGT